MIKINDRHWPLVVFHFSGAVTLAELEQYLVRQDALLARNEPTASLVFADGAKMWEIPVLRRQAAWIKANEATLRRLSLGAALVITSPMIRGMLKVVLKMQPMPQPHVVCATEHEALEWLRGRFQAAGLRVTLPNHM